MVKNSKGAVIADGEKCPECGFKFEEQKSAC
jgi:hypothetical protein